LAEERHASEAADLTSAGFDLVAYNNSLSAERPSLAHSNAPSADNSSATAEDLSPVALNSPNPVLADSSASTSAPHRSSNDPVAAARSVSQSIAEDPFEDEWVPVNTSTVTANRQIDDSASEKSIASESPAPTATPTFASATAAPDEATSSPFDLVIMPKRRAEEEHARPAGALASAPLETAVKTKQRKLRQAKPKEDTSEEGSHRTKRQKRTDATAATISTSSSDDDASVNTDGVAALRFRCESLAENNAALAKEVNLAIEHTTLAVDTANRIRRTPTFESG
jgi:hypothetical protein